MGGAESGLRYDGLRAKHPCPVGLSELPDEESHDRGEERVPGAEFVEPVGRVTH